MTLKNEVESVGTFVKSVVPGASLKYDVPTQPTKDNVVVRIQGTESESETGYHYRTDRTYQIVVYGEDALDVQTKMDALRRKCMDGKMAIPINGSLRYIRIGSFSFSAPIRTEGGLFACIGVMPTEVREARTQEQYDKIMHVYGRYEIRVPLQ